MKSMRKQRGKLGSARAKQPASGRQIKAATRIANEMRRAIITGELRPGDKLLSERELVEKLNVSRPTLREAMRLLEAESLIRITRGQHGGAAVQALDVSVVARQVGLFLQSQGTTLDDVWQARTYLEPPAAALLAISRPTGVLDMLREANARTQRSIETNDAAEFGASTADFSEILTEHAANKTLALLSQLLRDIVRRQDVDVSLRTYARKGVGKMRLLSLRGREKLTELIQSGAAVEAEKFWRQHLVETARHSLSAYRANMPIDVLVDSEPGSPSDLGFQLNDRTSRSCVGSSEEPMDPSSDVQR